ncbi:MAG TPA: hypothetical protein VH253_15910 [Phycisphaerae bacterium]|nr:hypothetical protein [Phycisphaerae bacterium]
MSDVPLKLRELRRILTRFGIAEDPSRGKGSHTLFHATIDGRAVSFPLPTSRDDINAAYIRAVRKKFHLTPQFGVSDREFYHG